MSEKNKPAHTIRGIPGSGLELTIWEHRSEKGPWYSATPSRSYKDGEQWKESTSFSQQDFLELAAMFRDAYDWIREQARNRSAHQGADPEQISHADRQTERKRAGGRA
jgi:hypothetical protein